MMAELRSIARVVTWAALLFWVSACAGDRGTDRTGGAISGAMAGSAAMSPPGGGPERGDDGAAPPAANAGAAGSGEEPAAPAGPGPKPGTFQPSATLDPSVTFSWPESSPGDGSSCQAGTYTGTFMCTFADPSGWVPSIDLTGPVSLTFEKSMNGEFLEITDGEFEAVANDVIGAQAQIQGKLDCTTLMLSAMALNGMWAIGDPDAPLFPGGGLTGDITGTLDPATGTLSGNWTFGDPAIGACPGTWSVTYAP